MFWQKAVKIMHKMRELLIMQQSSKCRIQRILSYLKLKRCCRITHVLIACRKDKWRNTGDCRQPERNFVEGRTDGLTG